MTTNFSIKSVTLNVHDLKSLSNYYQEIVGLQVLNQSDQKVSLGVTYKLLKLKRTEQNQKERTTGLYHFAILLDSREALGSFQIHLLKNRISALMVKLRDYYCDGCSKCHGGWQTKRRTAQ